MSDDHVVADRQHMTNPIAKLRLLGGVRLKPDVDGMEFVVAVDERSVRGAPNDVRGELFVQDVRIVPIVARLEPRGKLLGDPSGGRGTAPPRAGRPVIGDSPAGLSHAGQRGIGRLSVLGQEPRHNCPNVVVLPPLPVPGGSARAEGLSTSRWYFRSH